MNAKIYKKSVFQIIVNHTFTLFNILNIILALAILYFDSLKNLLFMGVVVCNTLIGIVQELYARSILNKMTVISKTKFTLKDNSIKEIDEICKNDLIVLNIGDQIVYEGTLADGELTVDESFITGESEYIVKRKGDKLLSGSFVVSGSGILNVEVTFDENFIYKIMSEGKKIKKVDSEIIKSLKKIIKVISIIILPLSVLIFCKQYYLIGSPINIAVVNTVASILGMIPEGLILLTSTVAAISIIKLNKYNVLIQNLYAPELVARTEIICFDKTGTLTTGEIKLVKVIKNEDSVDDVLNLIAANSKDNNKTMLAIKEKYNKSSLLKIKKMIPFDSKKKYMEIILDNDVTYRLGAPIDATDEIINYQKKYRVLTLTSENKIIAILLFEDELRKDIKNVINEYQKEKIKINVISGDDINTIAEIVKLSGINDVRCVDMSRQKGINYDELVSKYNIFGRVKPEQKQLIVQSLKKQGIVTYVGDGVNDVLALKEAHCSITFANASSAAKSVAEIVLLNSNFEVLPKIIKEGRRVIGNIERSASLFLSKTIFAILLTLIFLIVNRSYPFVPIQMTLISTMAIGFPGFILSLEASDDQVNKNFLIKIFKRSLPAGITVAINVIIILILNCFLNFSNIEMSTVCLLLTASVGFTNLYKVCLPFTKLRKCLFVTVVTLFLIQFIFFRKFFNIILLSFDLLLISIVLIFISIMIYRFLTKIIEKRF